MSAATTAAKKPESKADVERKKQNESPGGTKRYVGYFRVKIGTKEFSSQKGQFLGRPYVRLSTYQHSSTRFVINDPDGTIRDSIQGESEVEVEIGFGDAERRNIFVGKIYYVGRLGQDGTQVDAIDPSYQLQGQSGNSIDSTAQAPIPSKLAPKETAKAPLDSSATPLKPTDPDAPQPESLSLSSVAIPELDQLIAQANTLPAESTFDELTNLRLEVYQLQKQVNGQSATPLAEIYTQSGDNLKFANDSTFSTRQSGSVRLQQSMMGAAQSQALKQGDVVISRGNTVRQVSPGQQENSNVVLDYLANRGAFIGKPLVYKRSPLQLQSGYGSISVVGYNVNEKSMVGATVVTQAGATFDPKASITVPDWGTIKLGDPLCPGSSFTWGDMSHGGTRIPTKSVMEGAVRLAQAIQPIVNKSGKKWQVNSWYRDPAYNASIGGAINSRHTYGDAIDFYFDGMDDVHRSLYPDSAWAGGVAISPGKFVHLDVYGFGAGEPKSRRWTY